MYLSWSSGGVKGFKGTRKGTPFAAQIAAEDAAKKAATMGMKTVQVFVKGTGSWKRTSNTFTSSIRS